MSYPRWIVTLCLLIMHSLSASSLDERIEMHRTGFIVIQGPPDTTVKVTQCKHEFWFGAAISNRIFDGRGDEKDVQTCFAHPAVEGFLMWGFWEGANWIPTSSLYRKDWTPTAAAQAYLDLVRKAWWTDVTDRTDPSGRCTVRAFFGTHRIEVDGRSITVQLHQKQGAVKVDMP